MRRIITHDKLAEILHLHSLWLEQKKGGERANFIDMNLSSMDLCGADLRQALLMGADLRHAKLVGANLARAIAVRADFSGSGMTDADLTEIDLYSARLDEAGLTDACLRGAQLSRACLRGAMLYGADLTDASCVDTIFNGASLGYARMHGAVLRGACFDGAHLDKVTGFPEQEARLRQIVPQEGSFVIFKKVYRGDPDTGVIEFVAQLLVPEHAARSGGVVGRKVRVSEAVVQAVVDRHGDAEPAHLEYRSWHDPNFLYKVGATVRPANGEFDPDPWKECATGIHGFLTREEAWAW